MRELKKKASQISRGFLNSEHGHTNIHSHSQNMWELLVYEELNCYVGILNDLPQWLINSDTM